MASTTPITNTAFFRPTGISGCALWLDGADPNNNGIQPTSGTVISTWNDKSGNTRNATVASGRIAGTYNTSNKCVYFQSSSVGYVTSYAANPTVETMFIVANIDSPANINNNTIIGGQLGARSFGFGYAGVGGTGRSSYLNNEVAWQNNSIVGPSAGITALITGTVSNTTNVTVALNGATATSGTITAWTAGTTTYLGVDTTTTAYYYKGFVMEILFYNSVLTTTQRQQIEGYLAWKWGIQSSLPANHTYYNNPQQSIYPYTLFTTIPQPQTSLPSWSFFSPRSISSCSLWLDAADTTSFQFTSGANISNWNDKSGNGQNFTLLGTTSPVLLSNIQNRKSVVSFNGTNQTLRNTTLVFPNTAYTVFSLQLLASTVGNSSGYQRVIQTDPSFFIGVNGTSVAVFTGSNGAWNDIGALTPNFNNSNNWALVSTYSAPSGSSNTLSNFINGTQYNTKNGTTGNFTGLTIGGLPNSQYWNGYFAEFLLYSRVLSTVERQQIEGYLSLKWGLTTSLPTAHPTKSNFLYPILPLIPLPAVSQSTVPSFINTNARFAPSSLSGLALWLDASDAATVSLSSGVNVSNWNDKSGNVRNLVTVLSGSGTITYRSTSLVFSNTAYMFINTAVNLQNFTVFFIGKTLVTSGTANNQTIFCARPTSGFSYNATDALGLYYDYTATKQTRFYGSSSISMQDTVTFVDPVLNCYTQNAAGSLSSFLYGSNTANTATTARTTTAQGFAVGAEASSGGYGSSSTNNFQMNEVIVYSNILTTPQRQQVEGYLAWKWSLRSSLSSTHPNAFMPP